MSLAQKFKQRWEFRKRDDEIDSSTDDSRSNSSDRAVRKRHKLVSSLISPENGEEYDNLRSQGKSQLDSNMKVNFNLLEAPRKHIELSKKNNAVKHKVKRGSLKKNKQWKKNRGVQEKLLLDDFKIFTESMIAEIRDAREKIFAQMREEMTKLAAVGSTIRSRKKEKSNVQKNDVRPPQIRIKSGRKNQNCNGVLVEQFVKSNIALDSKNNSKAIEEQVNVDQALGLIASNRKDKGEISIPSVQKPIDLVNDSDQIVSSSYLTLPSVLSRPQGSHQRTGLYLRNHIQPGVAINSSASNLDRENSVIVANNHHGYFSNIQPEEQFGSMVPFSSKDLGRLDKHGTQTSVLGTGFPVPLHQGINYNFNIPTQTVLEESSRENNGTGLRTNGGATKFSQGSHALAERFITNCISNHMNYKLME